MIKKFMKRESDSVELRVKINEFLKLSSEICQIENIENMDIQELNDLKIKTIAYINSYLRKCMGTNLDRLYVYLDSERPDFSAYLALRNDKATLVFRQDEVGQAHHSYFDTAADVLKGMQFVENLIQKDKKEGKSL
ncbi:MAG: hypothetical protein IKR57_02735 [Bacilli bacterium]|nr:hypothetical protein [Bacilli bacterium]